MKALIKVKLETIGSYMVDCVSAREIYLKLGHNEQKWTRWYTKNIVNNEWFIEKRDWIHLPKVASEIANIGAGKFAKDFLVTVDFAKHIAMMAKTQKGHEYRNYLISCEKKLIDSQSKQLEAARKKLKGSIPLNPDCIKSVFKGMSNKQLHDDVYGACVELGLLTMNISYLPKYDYGITDEGWQYFIGFSKDGIIRINPQMHNALITLINGFINSTQTDWILEEGKGHASHTKETTTP